MLDKLLPFNGLLKCFGVEVNQHDFLTTIDELLEVDVIAVAGAEQADPGL